MSEVQKKEIDVVELLPQKVITCNVAGDQVAIIGAQLMSEKTIDMLTKAMDMVSTTGPCGLVFSKEEVTDGEGKQINAGFLHAVGMIVLSLPNILSDACNQILNGTDEVDHLPMNVRHIITLLMLRATSHEVHHAISWKADGASVNWEPSKTEEDDANTFAAVSTCEFAKNNSVEPVVGMEPYFEPKIQDFRNLLDEGTDENEVWENDHIEMIDNNTCWKENDNAAITLREYLRVVSNDKNNPEWDTVLEHTITEPAAAAPITPNYENYPDDGIPFGQHMDYPNDIPFDGPYVDGPQPVMQPAQQPMMQPAQAYAPPQTPNNDEWSIFMTALMKRLHLHIFEKCGWTGNGFFDPQYAGSIAQPVMVGDIPGAQKYITRYNGLNANGQWQSNIPFQGMMNGSLTKDGLPKYEFYLNYNGVELQRLFIVQNPSKGSKSAQEAMAGNKIAWLIDKNVPMGTQGGWKAKAYAGLGQVEAIIEATKT